MAKGTLTLTGTPRTRTDPRLNPNPKKIETRSNSDLVKRGKPN
jgi:hypothetical protein